MRFEELRLANVARCEDVFPPLDDWSPTDWACAMAGEAGEACNAVKKLRRGDSGASVEDIAAELADTVIYCDLLAARLRINLSEAIREKFNLVSDERGSLIRL